jgi:hypothetical protein
MTDSRHVLAKILSLAALAIFSIYFIDELAKEGGTTGGFLPVASPIVRGLSFQLSTLILSSVAFALSWKKPSFLISATLVTMGALMVIDGIIIGTRYLTILVLPGPIIGFTYGLAILVLGTAKSIHTGMLKATEVKSTR